MVVDMMRSSRTRFILESLLYVFYLSFGLLVDYLSYSMRCMFLIAMLQLTDFDFLLISPYHFRSIFIILCSTSLHITLAYLKPFMGHCLQT